MQNNGIVNGIVKVFAVLFALVCLYYISFSFVSGHYENKAREYALAKGGDSKEIEKAQQAYLDSMANEQVWLWQTLKQCRERELGLGLDLKGGMNVILEVSVPDVLRALAVDNPGETFETALTTAEQKAKNSQDDVITIFVNEFKAASPDTPLASVFASQRLKEKVMQNTPDNEVINVLRSEVGAAIDNSFTVLRTRIDRFGVVQPNIQKLESGLGRIMVELPGVKEPQRVRDLLSSSATLEFWETFTPAEVYNDLVAANDKVRNLLAAEATNDSMVADETTNADEVAEQKADTAIEADTTATDVAKSLLAGAEDQTSETEVSAQDALQNPIFSLLLNVSRANQGCVVGYADGKNRDQLDQYFDMANLRKDLSLKWGVKPEFVEGGKEYYALYAINVRGGKAPLTGDVVVDATDEYDNFSRPCVGMTMNTEGARKWAQLTGDNVNRCIAIVLDNYVYSAPNVSDKITGGRSSISGSFTVDETKDLANVLKSGKMPARTNIVNEEIVGPSLGQASINQGILSFVVAIVLLMLYMCTMYGVIPGMVANLALIFNIFFTVGVLASFQAALTLSGIAGMVLTLGMAVDANVLIYERTKEELRAGKNVRRALEDGYSNAFSAIFDSNITSLITAIILFNFGTGPIRGFATTLMIGIIISFFTAVFLTRVIYSARMKRDKWLNLTFTSRLTRKHVDYKYRFMESSKKSFIVWGIVFLACVVSFAVRGLKGGIDFTGGYNYVVTFEMKVKPEQVEDLLRAEMPEGTAVQVLALGTDGKTVRISTNYRIDESVDGIDAEIEHFIYEALRDGKLLTKNISYETFVDRENHTGGSIVSSTKVGPSIASDVKASAIWSVVLSLIAIGLYILLRFSNLSFSLGSTIALIFDTTFILGAYSMLQGVLPFSMEMDQTFIGAILTAIGYSINDKVVVFDRIREYLKLYPKRNTFKLFNDSLNTTLSRTVNTSFSTLIVLLCIFILGGDSIRSFSFAMILGVTFGTLSSIFIAAPIAYYFYGKKKKVMTPVVEEAPAPKAE